MFAIILASCCTKYFYAKLNCGLVSFEKNKNIYGISLIRLISSYSLVV